MSEQQWFFVKLVIGTALMWLVFGWVLPKLGLNPVAVVQAMFMAAVVWGLWTLRKIANK